MTDQRTIEDRLREEYSLLVLDIRRVTEQLEAEVRYCVLPILRKLKKYEHLVVKSRIKECESAIDSLRRRRGFVAEGVARQEGATFDRDRPTLYSLTDLKDLAGVRVLAFPRHRVIEVNEELRRTLRILGGGSGPWPRRERRAAGFQILRLLQGGEHEGSRRVPSGVDAYRRVHGSRAFGDLQARPGTERCCP